MTWCFKMFLQLPKGHLSFVDKWPLMNPNEIAFVVLSYLAFILKVGPLIMEKRQPLRLNNVLVYYNMVKILNSSILTYKFICYLIEIGLFPRKCEFNDQTMFVMAILYWKYMVTKILDLVDTFIFVVRKKSCQITFLHVYHHVYMVLMTWGSLKYDPSNHWAFMAMINSIIHVFMYTYYAISAMGPRYTKYLWWKKYLTMMQMIQFIVVFTQLIIQTSTSHCPMAAASYWVGLSNIALFICLFADFYNKRYRHKIKDNISMSCTGQMID